MKAECELYSYALLEPECYYLVQEKEDEALTLLQVKVETDNCMFVVKYADESITGLEPYTITEPSCSYDTNPGEVGLHVSLEVGTHTVLFNSLQGFPSWGQDIIVNDGCQTFK